MGEYPISQLHIYHVHNLSQELIPKISELVIDDFLATNPLTDVSETRESVLRLVRDRVGKIKVWMRQEKEARDRGAAEIPSHGVIDG